MAPITLVFGFLLIALGAGGYLAAEHKSVTALIPSFVGAPLVLLGLVALAVKERARMHVMHAAVLVGLLGFLGGLGNAIRVLMKPDGSLTSLAGLSTLGMTALCGLFVVLCVKSFIDARRTRQAREADEASGRTV
jgi:hypothetical protein